MWRPKLGRAGKGPRCVQTRGFHGFLFGVLLTRAPFDRVSTTATRHSPPKHVLPISTRSFASKPPRKSLTSEPKPRFFPPLPLTSGWSSAPRRTTTTLSTWSAPPRPRYFGWEVTRSLLPRLLTTPSGSQWLPTTPDSSLRLQTHAVVV